MIISASRRTDIPAFYSDWFFNRIKEGFVYVKNPMNAHQISSISLKPDLVDCIVFWTKNPEPMISRLAEIANYAYYFQFTLTGYGTDVETKVPEKKHLIEVFKRLSDIIGPHRVIWRYDPLLFNYKYTPEYHLHAFHEISHALEGYTDKCVISLVDTYDKNKKNLQQIALQSHDKQMNSFFENLVQEASDKRMKIATCAEMINLTKYGIIHNSCVDKTLIESIVDCKIDVKKDKTQRAECGCVESIDIGTYNTCTHGCKYCYANYSISSVEKNSQNYEVLSPLLCSTVRPEDKITERKVKSLKIIQSSFLD